MLFFLMFPCVYKCDPTETFRRQMLKLYKQMLTDVYPYDYYCPRISEFRLDKINQQLLD